MDEDSDSIKRSSARTEIGLKWLLLASLIINTGASTLWPITTLYTKEGLHQSMVVAGLVLTIMAFFMMLGNYIGGVLFDRWRPYYSITLSTGLSTMASILLIWWHAWPIYPLLLFIIGFGDGIINTNLYAYAAMVTHHSQRKVFNLLAVTMNLGVVLGTIIVGLLYQRGVTYIFLMAALMYLGCLSLVSLHFSLPALAKVIAKKAKKRVVFRPSKVVSAIAILVFTIYFGYVMWEAPIAVHMTNLGMSVQDYTNLWTINGLIIVFLQTVIGWLARKWSYQARVLIGSAIFAVSFLMLTTAKNYVLFICIMAILTLGEMLISPNVPIWVDNLVTENVRGQAQGFVNMMISLGRAVGPLIGGVIIEKYSYNVLFLCIFLLIMSVVLIIFMTNKVTRHNTAIDFDKS